MKKDVRIHDIHIKKRLEISNLYVTVADVEGTRHLRVSRLSIGVRASNYRLFHPRTTQQIHVQPLTTCARVYMYSPAYSRAMCIRSRYVYRNVMQPSRAVNSSR